MPANYIVGKTAKYDQKSFLSFPDIIGNGYRNMSLTFFTSHILRDSLF